MTVAEAYLECLVAVRRKDQTKKKDIKKLGDFYTYAVASGGDMNPGLAQSLLDDLSTDGEKIYSTKIQKFGADILKLLQIYGGEIPGAVLNRLNGW